MRADDLVGPLVEKKVDLLVVLMDILLAAQREFHLAAQRVVH